MNPDRTGYLLSPSAMMLRHGEGVFTQTVLLFSSVKVGASDFLTVRGGTSLFVPLLGGLYSEGGVKIGTKLTGGGGVTGDLHVAAWSRVIVLDTDSLSLFGGTLTVGDPDAHVSISAANYRERSLHHGEQSPLYGSTSMFVGSFSGFLRVSRWVGLVVDGFAVADPAKITLAGLGVRFFGEQLSTDAAVLWANDGAGGPLPFFSMSWQWD